MTMTRRADRHRGLARDRLIIIGISALAVWLAVLQAESQASSDLLATWMAGRAFATGAFDQIYPPATGLFTMEPPASWRSYLASAGYRNSVYPFIYPPLWAAVGSVLYRLGSFSALEHWAGVINPALLLGTLWLAIRNSIRPPQAALCYFVSIVLVAASAITLVALQQNQPQILVAFLTVLAVDRSRRERPWQAGLALALAASIKLYPVLFVAFWLARGRRRESMATLIFGVALGLASILIAGWPLHLQFLHLLGDISGTVLVNFFTWSLDPTVAQQVFFDRMTVVVDLRLDADPTPHGWQVMPKPLIWRLADLGLLLATLGWLARLARQPRGGDVLFWPLAFTLIALVSPLSWGYHYIASLVFLPALVQRLPRRIAIPVLLAVYLPGSTLVLANPVLMQVWKYVAQPAGTLSMVVYAIALARVLRPRPGPCGPPALAPPRRGL